MAVVELERYRHPDPPFEIHLPAGSELGIMPGTLIVARAPEDVSDSPFRTNLTVVAQRLPPGADREHYAAAALAQEAGSLPEWRLIDRAPARIDGLAAASCYYGGNIAQMTQMIPRCPTICHFGGKDAHIPLVGAVDKIQAAHPDLPVYVYEAGHGFARKGSSDYDAASDKLAFERTIELFEKAG